jgi:SAM-dependent methyltransferase
VTAPEVYGDDELAVLYDLVYAGDDDDLVLYEQFARRGETPSLELGAGSGRVALHLARAGLDVVALDASPHMLARLESQLDDATRPRVRTTVADMREFDLGQKFDLVYCALSTFEQLLTTEDQLRSLRCVAAHLADGGAFVAQLRNATAVEWSPEPSPLVLDFVREDPATGETVCKLRSARASAASQTTTDTIVFDRIGRDGTVRRRTFDVTLRVTGRFELELLLERAGMRLSALYGGPDLSPFDDASNSMVVVAERAR